MVTQKEKYITDAKGKRTQVVLDIRDYKRLMSEMEELESIRAFDEAKRSTDEAIPLAQALHEIGLRD